MSESNPTTVVRRGDLLRTRAQADEIESHAAGVAPRYYIVDRVRYVHSFQFFFAWVRQVVPERQTPRRFRVPLEDIGRCSDRPIGGTSPRSMLSTYGTTCVDAIWLERVPS
jgi:hypothetical protein